MEITFNHVSIIAFYALIVYFIIKNKSKIEFHKIYLLYKTKAGIELIDKIAKWRFWKWWAYLGIPVGFLGMFAIFGLLFTQMIEILTQPSVGKSVQLILPGISMGSVGPFMFMPFWTFIICITVIILVHEGAHGIISRVHNLKIRSTGLGLFTIIPLAFVEPDEKQLDKSSVMTQLSVFAAGPFANICTAFVVVLISSFVLIPMAGNVLEPAGLEISDVLNDFPAQQAGILPDDTIIAVNGIDTLDTASFEKQMLMLNPGESATLTLQDRDVLIETVANPTEEAKPYIGISFKQSLKSTSETRLGMFFSDVLLYLINLASWLVMLNIGIALINLLPLGPVDGGRMLKTGLERVIKNPQTAKSIWFIVSMAALGFLLVNIFGPIII
jgi:membrane-associated protease RseP (regulator of RpoE activity)